MTDTRGVPPYPGAPRTLVCERCPDHSGCVTFFMWAGRYGRVGHDVYRTPPKEG